MSIFVFIICSNPLSTFAQTENQQQYYNQPIEEETSINEIENPFASMSIDELQSFVDSIANTSYNTDIESSSSVLSFPRPRPVISTSNGIWKLAWLAAAEIARQMGYPAAATLVEHSIENNDYIEIEGYSGNTFFKEKIIKTNAYKSFIKSGKSFDGIEFKKEDDADLFYAIHHCASTLTTANGRSMVCIYDEFNFELWDYEGNIFASIINNTGLYFQMRYVLNEIDVYIVFYR